MNHLLREELFDLLTDYFALEKENRRLLIENSEATNRIKTLTEKIKNLEISLLTWQKHSVEERPAHWKRDNL